LEAGIWISAPVAGLRADRGLALGDGERAETDQAHFLTGLQRRGDRIEHGVDCLTGLSLGEISFFGDHADQIILVGHSVSSLWDCPPSLANRNGVNLLRFYGERKEIRAFLPMRPRNSVNEPSILAQLWQGWGAGVATAPRRRPNSSGMAGRYRAPPALPTRPGEVGRMKKERAKQCTRLKG
jgi:hypothetical protein